MARTDPRWRSTTALVTVSLVACLAMATPAVPCTTAVIAGSATADGRPLLWKNRDADDKRNQAVYDATGRYAFVGLVNGGDVAALEVWSGINAAGLAIMNAASYNLDKGESAGEGQLMRLVLQSCATVEEFQALLERTNAPGRDVDANFGVIDARGGAAYFETGRHAFARFDATDPKTAPTGVLVRTNYSDSGDPEEGSGILRRERATALIERLRAGGKLTATTLLADVARDVANPHIGFSGAPGGAVRFACTADSVCRFDTASASVFVGVRGGEDPLLATAWFITGQPVTGAAVPVWVRAAAIPDEISVRQGASVMTQACDAVRARLYPQTRGELKRYIDAAALAGPSPAIVARLVGAEGRSFDRVQAALASWRVHPPSPPEVAALQAEIAAATIAAVRTVATSTAP
jgi:hypothetical protein